MEIKEEIKILANKVFHHNEHYGYPHYGSDKEFVEWLNDNVVVRGRSTVEPRLVDFTLTEKNISDYEGDRMELVEFLRELDDEYNYISELYMSAPANSSERLICFIQNGIWESDDCVTLLLTDIATLIATSEIQRDENINADTVLPLCSLG